MNAVLAAQLDELTLAGDYEIQVDEITPISLGPVFGIRQSFHQAAVRFVPKDSRHTARDVLTIPKEFPTNRRGSEARALKSAEAMLAALRELRGRNGERFEMAFRTKERAAGRKHVPRDRLVAAIKAAVRQLG